MMQERDADRLYDQIAIKSAELEKVREEREGLEAERSKMDVERRRLDEERALLEEEMAQRILEIQDSEKKRTAEEKTLAAEIRELELQRTVIDAQRVHSGRIDEALKTGRVLNTRIEGDIAAARLMKEFHRTASDGRQRYDCIVLLDGFNLTVSWGDWLCMPVLEELPVNDPFCRAFAGTVTWEDLQGDSCAVLLSHAGEEMETFLKEHGISRRAALTSFVFERPLAVTEHASDTLPADSETGARVFAIVGLAVSPAGVAGAARKRKRRRRRRRQDTPGQMQQ